MPVHAICSAGQFSLHGFPPYVTLAVVGSLVLLTQHRYCTLLPSCDLNRLLVVQEDFSRVPIGEDENERQYWLHDLRSRGFRLCRETLPSASDVEPCSHYHQRDDRGFADAGVDIEGGAWETLACTLDAVEEVSIL